MSLPNLWNISHPQSRLSPLWTSDKFTDHHQPPPAPPSKDSSGHRIQAEIWATNHVWMLGRVRYGYVGDIHLEHEEFQGWYVWKSRMKPHHLWLNNYFDWTYTWQLFGGGRVLVVENSFLFYKKAFAKSSRQGWPPLENCAVVKWSVTSPVGPQPPENSRKRRYFRWALNWEDAYDSTTARKYRRNPKGQRLCFGPQQPLHIGLLRETCIFYKTYQFWQGLN